MADGITYLCHALFEIAKDKGVSLSDPPASVGTKWLNDLLLIRKEDWQEAKELEEKKKKEMSAEAFLESHGVQI